MSDQTRTEVRNRVEIRPLESSDSLEEITQLLHRAYAPLAEMGLRYVATHQTVEITRKRFERGLPFVCTLDGRIVGTITIYPDAGPHSPEWYERPEVASFGQFAVVPELQRHGIGERMMAFAEEHILQLGRTELALDTSDKAQHLIDWYLRLGWRIVGEVDYSVTNYKSVVLSKRCIE